MNHDTLRREAWWIAGAGGVTLTGAALHNAYGAWAWVGAFTLIAGIRPARRVWGWTAPRRPGVIPPAKGPRKMAERVSPRLRATGLATRLERDWPNICREAQWSRGDAAPSLVYCRADGDHALALAWRPWINQGEKTWDALAQTVRRAVSGQTVRWWINPGDAGLLEVRIGLKALPTRVELHAPPPPAAIDGTGRFWLGPQAGGGDASWCPLESPHMLIAGSTNYGKGGTLRIILAQAAGWRVRVWNPKDSGEFRWVEGLPDARVVTTPQDAVLMLREIDQERQRIQALIKDRGVDRWCELPPDLRPTPTLLMVDEASEALDGDDKWTQEAADLLVTQARMIRSAGGVLVVATQRPDVAGGALGRRGGQLRAQLTARLVVGRIDKAGLGMVLEGRDADVLAGLPGMPGRALATGLDAQGGSDVYVVQVAWLPQDAALRGTRAPLAGGVAEVVSEVTDSDTPPLRGGGVSETGSRPASSAITPGSGGVARVPRGDVDAGTPGGVDADMADPPCADGPVPPSGPVDTGDPAGDIGVPDGQDRAEAVSLAEAAERLACSERTVRRWAADASKPHVRSVGWGRFEVDV